MGEGEVCECGSDLPAPDCCADAYERLFRKHMAALKKRTEHISMEEIEEALKDASIDDFRDRPWSWER